jgi:hypothetical protein
MTIEPTRRYALGGYRLGGIPAENGGKSGFLGVSCGRESAPGEIP